MSTELMGVAVFPFFMFCMFFLFLILLAEHSGTIWCKHFISSQVCTVYKWHVRKAKNAHRCPEWFLPLFCKPPLNESSSWLLIGWDPAIPRDCLAEAERPCFHSQKHWYASRLFHSHKRLKIAPSFSMVFCSFPCVFFWLVLLLYKSLPHHPCLYVCLCFWGEKADVLSFFLSLASQEREILGRTAVRNLQHSESGSCLWMRVSLSALLRCSWGHFLSECVLFLNRGEKPRVGCCWF